MNPRTSLVFPDTILPIHRDSLRSLRDAIRVRFGSLISDLGDMEQINRSYIDSIYACSTNALSQELEEVSRLRLYPIVVQPLVEARSPSRSKPRPFDTVTQLEEISFLIRGICRFR